MHRSAPHPEYRALARVHWRAEALVVAIGRGGGTIIVSRLRSSSPLMITRRGIHKPFYGHHADARAGILRKHGIHAAARGPRPGAPGWVCDGRWFGVVLESGGRMPWVIDERDLVFGDGTAG